MEESTVKEQDVHSESITLSEPWVELGDYMLGDYMLGDYMVPDEESLLLSDDLGSLESASFSSADLDSLESASITSQDTEELESFSLPLNAVDNDIDSDLEQDEGISICSSCSSQEDEEFEDVDNHNSHASRNGQNKTLYRKDNSELGLDFWERVTSLFNFECPYCGLYFHLYDSLTSHVTRCHVDRRVPSKTEVACHCNEA